MTGELAVAMTQDEMRQALGVGPEWRLIWAGEDPLPDLEHICGGLHRPGGTYLTEYRRLAYTPTGTPGIEAARCERCRAAWVLQRGGSVEEP